MNVKTQMTGAALLVAAVLIFFPACDANRRYAVLSFLFDGVPKPESGEPKQARGEEKRPGADAENKGYFQHGPYAARLCDGCHEPRSNKLLLPKEELCLFCHAMPVNRSTVHGPLAAGGCMVCHDPHGTSPRAPGLGRKGLLPLLP